MTTPDETAPNCLNCGHAVGGAYCSHCGQAAVTGRLRLRAIIDDALSHIVSADSAGLRTVIGLTRAPGRVCRDYVEGKRVGYVKPLRYFLTLVALKVLLNVVVGFDVADFSDAAELTEAEHGVEEAVGSFAIRHLDLALFAMLPLFTLVVGVLFRGKGYNYAEVSVYVLYLTGHVLLLGLPLTPLKLVWPGLLVPVAVLLQMGWFAWAAVTFFDSSVFASIAKSVVATLVYYMLIVVTVGLLALPRVMAALAGGTP